MDPSLAMLVLFLVISVVAFFTICGPIYVGMWSSLYFIYDAKGAGETQALSEIKYDTDKVIDQYLILFDHWMIHSDTLDFQTFTLPLFLPPAIGAVVSVALTYAVVMYIINIFRVTD